MSRMPVIFSGHGDPMIALRTDAVTQGMRQMGEHILTKYGKPKAILAVSAHWYTRGTFVQTAARPKQLYDMYGFPEALYRVQYPVRGNIQLSHRVLSLLGKDVQPENQWGIDHGTWTVLLHMFPGVCPGRATASSVTPPSAKHIPSSSGRRVSGRWKLSQAWERSRFWLRCTSGQK